MVKLFVRMFLGLEKVSKTTSLKFIKPQDVNWAFFSLHLVNSGARQACCWLNNWVKCVCALAVVVCQVVCRLCGQRGPLWPPPHTHTLNTFPEKFPAIISTTLQITEFYAEPQARSNIPKFSLVQRLWLVVKCRETIFYSESLSVWLTKVCQALLLFIWKDKT